MRICVQYCGSCNPQLDLSQIEEGLRREAERSGLDHAFVSPGEENDLCILLNGCPVGCADLQHTGSGPVKRLLARGWKTDGQPDWTWEEGEKTP
ncbi:MAG: hypothetical protein V1878_05830 [bacterium]|jgi:hypothetical protein